MRVVYETTYKVHFIEFKGNQVESIVVRFIIIIIVPNTVVKIFVYK